MSRGVETERRAQGARETILAVLSVQCNDGSRMCARREYF